MTIAKSIMSLFLFSYDKYNEHWVTNSEAEVVSSYESGLINWAMKSKVLFLCFKSITLISYKFVSGLTVSVPIFEISEPTLNKFFATVENSYGSSTKIYLSSTFAGSNQIMGVRRTNDFIEKVTWTLAGLIALFAILSAYTMDNGAIQSESRVKVEQAPAAATTFDAAADTVAAEAAPVVADSAAN